MSEHLAFAPEILRRLGEELIPHPDQGLVELARNSYDADATFCTIEILTDALGGRISISDNGDGMTGEAIRSSWLVLGRSSKDKRRVTRLNRVPAGDKGLGRLAALRLGRGVTLSSRPLSEPGTEYRLTINWDRFDEATLVEDVDLDIEKISTHLPPGTVIELTGLRSRFRRSDLQRLARSLVLLSDPFESDSGFRAELKVPDFVEIERRVRTAYFDEIEYRIHGNVDSEGNASATLLDWKGELIDQADHRDISSRSKRDASYATPALAFDLWVFNLSGDAFSHRAASVTEVRDWLGVVGGVHVYQNNLRVPPYGDPGVDWLDMNLRRVRSPEFRPSTNTSIGRVVLSDDGTILLQKTDRSGFVEGEGFSEMRSFAMDVLDWSASQRLKEAEKRRQSARARDAKDQKSTAHDVKTVAKTLADSSVTDAADAFRRYQVAIERQMAGLREDVFLYRTLATVGTTTAAFAHESIKPAKRVGQLAQLLGNKGRRIFGQEFDTAVGEQLTALRKSAEALGSWAELPLHLLRRDGRRRGRFEVGETLETVSGTLQPFLTEAGIELVYLQPLFETPVYGSPVAAEAIVMNLVVNSINALVADDRPRARRQIVIHWEEPGDGFATWVIADSGPGISGIELDEIWLPGRTTREGGTGLGLTIVRDSAADLGGEVTVEAKGSLGGAEFAVRLPLLDHKAHGPT